LNNPVQFEISNHKSEIPHLKTKPKSRLRATVISAVRAAAEKSKKLGQA
jgi:hypothetical protein